MALVPSLRGAFRSSTVILACQSMLYRSYLVFTASRGLGFWVGGKNDLGCWRGDWDQSQLDMASAGRLFLVVCLLRSRSGAFYMGGCQNHGPFSGTLNTRCRIIKGIQKGTIILTTTPMRALKMGKLISGVSKAEGDNMSACRAGSCQQG